VIHGQDIQHRALWARTSSLAFWIATHMRKTTLLASNAWLIAVATAVDKPALRTSSGTAGPFCSGLRIVVRIARFVRNKTILIVD
ncbi:MAG: hypothetical protein Q8S73_00005, partial [Deltaproteobacteria bacterium]|nr:hypothetical protein [Deltaproteobacteria bacterium]